MDTWVRYRKFANFSTRTSRAYARLWRTNLLAISSCFAIATATACSGPAEPSDGGDALDAARADGGRLLDDGGVEPGRPCEEETQPEYGVYVSTECDDGDPCTWDVCVWGEVRKQCEHRPAPGLCVGYADVSADATRGCGLDEEGGVWCWGTNESGEAGTGVEGAGTLDGDSAIDRVVVPTRLELPAARQVEIAPGSTTIYVPEDPTGPGAQVCGRVSTGSRYSCALAVDGTVWCWGDNALGVIGPNAAHPRFGNAQSPWPVQVVGVERVEAIALGPEKACGLRDDGSVVCWGGHPNYAPEPPETITPPEPLIEIDIPESSCGFHNSGLGVGRVDFCGVSSSGRTYCYYADGSEPWFEAVSPASDYRAIRFFGYSVRDKYAELERLRTHGICAVDTDGAVHCTAASDSTGTCRSTTPTEWVLAGASSLDAGGAGACAVTVAGVQCFGMRMDRYLGDTAECGDLLAVEPFEPPPHAPVATTAGAEFVRVGGPLACVVLHGEIRCWAFAYEDFGLHAPWFPPEVWR